MGSKLLCKSIISKYYQNLKTIFYVTESRLCPLCVKYYRKFCLVSINNGQIMAVFYNDNNNNNKNNNNGNFIDMNFLRYIYTIANLTSTGNLQLAT